MFIFVVRIFHLFDSVRVFHKYSMLTKFDTILLYKSQQDAQVTEFLLTDNCSTCFGRHYHPSSGAQNNCNYSIW